MGLKHADWAFWNQMPNAELWECVCLSLDYEPRSTSFNSVASYKVDTGYRDIWPRLEIAKTHAELRIQPFAPLRTLGGTAMWRFSIPAFITWAKGMGWHLPSEFSGFAVTEPSEPLPKPATTKSAAAAEVKPAITETMKERERNNLYRVVGAMLNYIKEGERGGRKHPDYKSEAKLIAYLAQHYSGYEGVSKPKLEAIFANAKQLLK